MAKKKKELKKQKKIAKQRNRALLELQRKPSFRKEFKRAFAVVAAIVLLFDLVITCIWGTSYIDFGKEMIYTLSEDCYDHINSLKKYCDYDFSNYENREKMLAEDEKREKDNGTSLYQLLARLDWQTNMAFGNEYKYSYFGRTLYDIQEQIKNNINKSEQDSHYAYHAIYSKNGKLISKNTGNVYFLYIDKTKEHDDVTRSNTYELDMEYIRKHCPEVEKTFDEAYENKLLANFDCELDEVYVKGYYFIPQKIKITLSKNSLFTQDTLYNDDYESNRIVEVDLSSSDFAGYTKVVLDDTHIAFGPFNFGNRNPLSGREQGSSHETYYNSLGEEYFSRYILEYYENTSDASEQDNYITNGIFSFKGFNLLDSYNDSLVCVTVVDYNFFRDWKCILILFYSISLIIVLIISLVIAKKRLTKKQLLYEMDSYRRRTTNAMAHDLKSPLMIISGSAENIYQIEKNEQIKQFTDDILEAVKDMDQMIANILDLAKLEDVSLKLERVEVSLAELIGREITKKQAAMEEKGITCQINGDVKLQCDANQMTRLIDNLLSNAIKYGTKDSVIEIQLDDTHFTMDNRFDGNIQVDTKELLEPFVKGNHVRTNATGNGLGLSIVNQIAMAHGYEFNISIEEEHFVVEVKF